MSMEKEWLWSTQWVLNPVVLSTNNYNTELEKTKSIVSNNGYPYTTIDKIIYKKRKQLIIKTIYPTPTENIDTKFYTLNYVKGESYKIENMLRMCNIKTIWIKF